MAFWEDLGDVQVVVVLIITKGWLNDHLSVTSRRSGQLCSEGLWGKFLSEEMAPAHSTIMGDILPFQATL